MCIRDSKLLDQILDEFGLVVCGWSAEWDAALRSAIERCRTRRFTTYWTTLGPLTNAANELVKLRHAQVIDIRGADSFFVDLSEKVDSLADLSRQRPLAKALEVAALKRYLADPKYRIELRDLVAAERERVHRELFSDRFPAQGVPPTHEQIAKRVSVYESLTEGIRDVIIAGCYYGEQQHVSLWTECIDRLASLAAPEAGYENLDHPQTISSSHLTVRGRDRRHRGGQLCDPAWFANEAEISSREPRSTNPRAC